MSEITKTNNNNNKVTKTKQLKNYVKVLLRKKFSQIYLKILNNRLKMVINTKIIKMINKYRIQSKRLLIINNLCRLSTNKMINQELWKQSKMMMKLIIM